MNKYFRYIYILLIIILIGFVNSGDNPAGKKGESVGYGYGATPVDTEEDDEINFDLVVRELESLVTEDDHETAGDTVISDNILQHGLGHIICNEYTSQQPPQTPQQPHQGYQQTPTQFPPHPQPHPPYYTGPPSQPAYQGYGPTQPYPPAPYEQYPQPSQQPVQQVEPQPVPQDQPVIQYYPLPQQPQPGYQPEKPLDLSKKISQPTYQPVQPPSQQQIEQEEPLDLSKKTTQTTQHIQQPSTDQSEQPTPPQEPQQHQPGDQQQDQPLPSQPSNLGPGILGPAPGPLRDPSEIIKEYDQLADKLTTAAKDEEYKKQPTKEPQQEPSTQHAQEPTGLHPETITVEVGSDEEEEPPKEPPGPPKKPGDGDKPEEGDDDGDDDDEDKYDKKKPFKENKKRCQSIKFYKKDKNGLPVEFNLFDYDIQWNDIFLTIYNFLISPFIIECDGMVVWERTNKNFKPKSMTYNKKHNTFVIRVRCHFLLQKLVNGKWQEYIFDIPKYVNLYREDTEGNIVLMNEFDYDLNLTPRGHFKYNVDGLKCCRIEYRNKGVLWEKTPGDNYPLIICLAERMGVLIYFEGKTQIYGRRKGVFKLLITKKNRRISRLK
uniref:Conserved Theileria-specific sub-telomeric protein, SVSP family n=1 Tax=Theileria annulata TaxID=5874 RepID=A0A3B0N5I0_THEAN